MNERERAVNQDLQTLGDAYRLGQIRRDDYRARRRRVLASLKVVEGDTTRQPPRAGRAGGEREAGGGKALPGMRPVWKYGLLLAVALSLLVVLLYLRLGEGSRSAAEPEAVSMASPSAPPEVLSALEVEAEQFLIRDDWQPASVSAWLQRWQAVDEAARRAALGRPVLQRMRAQLAYEISVQKALQGGDTPAADTAVLEQLARALDPAA